jgi:hypothetical protein
MEGELNLNWGAVNQPELVQAPQSTPPDMVLMIDRSHLFHAQYMSERIEYIESDDTPAYQRFDPAYVITATEGIRHLIAPISSLVGLSDDNTTHLHNLVWCMVDTRGLLATVSTDPAKAQVGRLGSMAIFSIRAVLADPNNKKWSKTNTVWQVVLIENKMCPPIEVPGLMILSYEELMKGYLALTPLPQMYPSERYPPNAIFCLENEAHQPVTPQLAARAQAASSSTTRIDSNSGIDLDEEMRRNRAEGRNKQSARDAVHLQAFQGMTETFDTFSSPNIVPIYDEVADAVLNAVSDRIIDCYPSKEQLKQLMKGQTGSKLGVSSTNRVSIYSMFALQPGTVLNDWYQTMPRVSAAVEVIFGPAVAHFFKMLVEALNGTLIPTHAGTSLPLLGVKGAIDIVNSTIHLVATDSRLYHLEPRERWQKVIANAPNTGVWQTAVVRQTEINTRSVVTDQIKLIKGATTNPTPKDRRKRKQANPQRVEQEDHTTTTSSSTTTDPTTTSTGRCFKQDDPDGCPFGLKCKFEHDPDNPKLDNTTHKVKKTGSKKHKKKDD